MQKHCSPKLLVAVDHKPLIRIFNDRQLDTIENPRLLHLKEKSLSYQFEIIHVPGEENGAANFVSRYPSESDDVGDEDEAEADLSVAAMNTFSQNESMSCNSVKREAMLDDECVILCKQIQDGFPAKKEAISEK